MLSVLSNWAMQLQDSHPALRQQTALFYVRFLLGLAAAGLHLKDPHGAASSGRLGWCPICWFNSLNELVQLQEEGVYGTGPLLQSSPSCLAPDTCCVLSIRNVESAA